MRYVMSLDGGGSKLLCLIADEHGTIVGKSLQGSVNSYFNSQDTIAANVRLAIAGSLEDGQVAGKDIACVYVALPAVQPGLSEIIRRELCDSGNIHFITEFDMSLYGAVQKPIGGLVQAGTGSFAEIRTESETIRVGGWGALIGDEGSGTYIGRLALSACAQMTDGRGTPTLLKERIFHALNIGNDIERLMERIYCGDAARQRTLIASLCPIVGHCAAEGDEVALNIIADSGKQLARQITAALRRCADPRNVVVTVAGGVWKTHPLVYQSFHTSVLQEFPNTCIVPPRFEPVAGGLLLGLAKIGMPILESISMYNDKFANYRLDDKMYFVI